MIPSINSDGKLPNVHASRTGELPPVAQRVFRDLSALRCGRLEIVGPGGRSVSFAAALPGPDAVLEVCDWDVARRALHGRDADLSEAYLDGRCDTPDLCSLLALFASNAECLEQASFARGWRRLQSVIRTIKQMRPDRWASNVHSLYELDNGFYELWLDDTMTYSSACFDGDFSKSLEEGQTAKYERILRLCQPRAGSSILEIGCGWGEFARYAAHTRACRVHAITLSRRQRDWAQRRLRAAGLDRLVTVDVCDYRQLQGCFDHVVSIEMYETLGERAWPGYFEALGRRLKPGGCAVLQAIVVSDNLFESYKQRPNFIRQHIYRGAMLASACVIQRHAQRAGFEIQSMQGFANDYAETLRRWRERFRQSWPQIQGNGRDTRLRRLWDFYLAYCEAGFRAGVTDVLQIAMARP